MHLPPVRVQQGALRITLSGLDANAGSYLTLDTHGRKLLETALTFQCAPLEQFGVTRQFTMGNYDTVTGSQFSRRGSEQLRVWQFDTLAVWMSRSGPTWVPFPMEQTLHINLEPGLHGSPVAVTGRPIGADWYRDQLGLLHASGSPFWFTAALTGASSPVLHAKAVLVQYDEQYKHGEDDAIYFTGMSFSEWRDPTIKQAGLGRPKGTKDDWVDINTSGRDKGIAFTDKHRRIPAHGSSPATLAMLAKSFYGEPGDWRRIAHANSLKGGSANTPILKFSKYTHVRAKTVRLKVPGRQAPMVTTGPVKTPPSDLSAGLAQQVARLS